MTSCKLKHSSLDYTFRHFEIMENVIQLEKLISYTDF